MTVTVWIALGGAIGSVARYWLALWTLPLSRDLPWGTIGINIAGSFLIGFFGTLTLEADVTLLPSGCGYLSWSAFAAASRPSRPSACRRST